MKRPVTGRDGLGTIEGEDYDGQSGATKEDSNDTDLGQSISVTSGGSIFYDVVDFSDAGVGSVQMRVNASAATNLDLHADSADRHAARQVRGRATSGAWATQSCTLTPTSGVHTLYVVFGGAARLNWLLFQRASGSTTGTGGSGAGTGGTSGTGGAAAAGGTGGTGTPARAARERPARRRQASAAAPAARDRTPGPADRPGGHGGDGRQQHAARRARAASARAPAARAA